MPDDLLDQGLVLLLDQDFERLAALLRLTVEEVRSTVQTVRGVPVLRADVLLMLYRFEELQKAAKQRQEAQSEQYIS